MVLVYETIVMQCMGVGDKAFSLPQTIYNPTAPTSPSYFVY